MSSNEEFCQRVVEKTSKYSTLDLKLFNGVNLESDRFEKISDEKLEEIAGIIREK